MTLSVDSQKSDGADSMFSSSSSTETPTSDRVSKSQKFLRETRPGSAKNLEVAALKQERRSQSLGVKRLDKIAEKMSRSGTTRQLGNASYDQDMTSPTRSFDSRSRSHDEQRSRDYDIDMPRMLGGSPRATPPAWNLDTLSVWY